MIQVKENHWSWIHKVRQQQNLLAIFLLVVKGIWFGDNAVPDSLIQSRNLMSGYNLKQEVKKSSWQLFFHIKEKGIKHIVIAIHEDRVNRQNFTLPTFSI